MTLRRSRKNSDVSLRALERMWLAHGDPHTRERLEVARFRAGVPFSPPVLWRPMIEVPASWLSWLGPSRGEGVAPLAYHHAVWPDGQRVCATLVRADETYVGLEVVGDDVEWVGVALVNSVFDGAVIRLEPAHADSQQFGRHNEIVLRIVDGQESMQSNPSSDESIQELRRLVAATGEPAARMQLYFALERVGQTLPPDEESKVIEFMRDTKNMIDAEADRRQRERALAGRLTRREQWLIRGLIHIDAEMAVVISRLMRKIELDPWGTSAADVMDQIGEILGSDRGRIDAFDSDDGPRYVYVSWGDFDRPTLFWSYARDKFSIRTTASVMREMDRD